MFYLSGVARLQGERGQGLSDWPLLIAETRFQEELFLCVLAVLSWLTISSKTNHLSDISLQFPHRGTQIVSFELCCSLVVFAVSSRLFRLQFPLGWGIVP